jgi:transcription-repair coupling factor (superfamily II helicase)
VSVVATDKNSIEVFKENYQKTFDNTGGFIFDEVSESRLPSGIEFYLSLFFTHLIFLHFLNCQSTIVVVV